MLLTETLYTQQPTDIALTSVFALASASGLELVVQQTTSKIIGALSACFLFGFDKVFMDVEEIMLHQRGAFG
jgi:hypothetical protein